MALAIAETDNMVIAREQFSAAATEVAVADILAGPCRLYGVSVKNGDASTRYLRLWDAANPVNGTTAPDHVIPITASKTGGLGISEPLVFSTGLSFVMVTVGGTAGATGPTAATDVVLTLKKGAS